MMVDGNISGEGGIARCTPGGTAPPLRPSPHRPCERRKNMYIHVRGRLEKSLEKVKKRLKKYSQRILQVVQVKEKRKKFLYFPRGQRQETGLRLRKVLLKLPPTPNQ